MNRLILTFVLIILSVLVFAQTPDWQWAVQSFWSNIATANAIDVDYRGCQVIGGIFQGTAYFGSTMLVSNGDYDIYVAKLDREGNWLWAFQAGGHYSDKLYDIAYDRFGYAYIIGSFSGTASFGPFTLNSDGINDIFIAKISNSGTILWAIQAGGYYFDEGYGIDVDSACNVYITGCYTYDGVFGPFILPQGGNYSTFVCRLTPQGEWVWARNAAGSSAVISSVICRNITTDVSGNVYIIGWFTGGAVFGDTELISSNSTDGFIAKMYANGNWAWARKVGGTCSDICEGVACDNWGNVYVCGEFSFYSVFGPFALTGFGDYDAFLAKLDSEGNWLWAINCGSNGTEYGRSICIDDSANVYLTGSFSSTAEFGSVNLTSSGVSDIFVAKIDAEGDWEWVVQAGGAASDRAYDICLDYAGNLLLTGYFNSDAVFGPIILSSVYNNDNVFVAKLGYNTESADDVLPILEGLSQLFNAYPNPFHPGETTIIKTDIAKSETGSLSIYNLKGQLIKAYDLSSGTHEITLNSRNLASGIYFYSLNTPTTHVTKKLVLLK
jgi:hypothetical protein